MVMLYNSLILPHINYGILVWGYACKRVTILQKKAIRIITLSKHNSHTEPLFKRLNLLNMFDIHKLCQLKFYYKYVNHMLPEYFLNIQIVPNSNIHPHNTRTKNDMHIMSINHEFAKKCIRFSLPILINNTAQLITDKIYTHSLKGFATYVKNVYLSVYNEMCYINDCYICSRD